MNEFYLINQPGSPKAENRKLFLPGSTKAFQFKGHGIGKPLAAGLLRFIGLAELETMSDALGDAGRLQALVHPVLAIIALHHFPGFRMPLGRAPRTGGNTGFAADAQGRLHKDDTVLGTFVHSPGGAHGHAPGLLAVETRHEDKSHAGNPAHHLGAHGHDLPQPGAQGQPFIGFAVHLAAQAADASFLVLNKIILAHKVSSYYQQ
jgi:hypothetical protein